MPISPCLRQWGAYTQDVPGHRNVHPLIKEAADSSGMVFGEGWHTDSPFLPEPPAITTLRSVETPPLGGDTTWANSALAYSMLSETYRRMIDGLKVHFSLRDVLKASQEAVEVSDSPIGRLTATRDSARLSKDLVRKMRGNLRFLTEHLTQPAFGCRLRWEPAMLVIWDNRFCVHQAYNDYQGYRREVYRTTVRGEKPT